MALDEEKVAEKGAVWGDEGEFAGHAPHSNALLKTAFPEIVAPADRNDYDPADYTDQPGAAARANHYPRAR